MYFRSNGAQRPTRQPTTNKVKEPESERELQKPVEKAEPQKPDPVSLEPDRKVLGSRKRQSTGEILEFSVGDALKLQAELREGFAHSTFQDSLKQLQQRFPHRKHKGHADGQAYFHVFEELTLSVHKRILPGWGLEPDWNGVRTMLDRMSVALKHTKVKKAQEEINVLMGLPRNAEFHPTKKEEEMFSYRAERDGAPLDYNVPLVMDEDGDEGHEFFVEDPETGDLQIQVSALNSDCWYEVVHKPAVVIRSKPNVKAEMVGRTKAGKRIHIQYCRW